MIRIVWSATTTERDDVLGGDSLTMQFSELQIDATIRESSDFTAMATEHSIEDGADITDHIHPGLRRISLDCIITNHPIYEGIDGGVVTTVALALPEVLTFGRGATPLNRSEIIKASQKVSAARVLTFPDPKDRVKEGVAVLEKLVLEGTRVDILDLRFGDLYDWVITSVNPYVENTDAVKFTLNAQEIRTANTLMIDAPRPRVERARRQAARGAQTATTGAETAARQEIARSALLALGEMGARQLYR